MATFVSRLILLLFFLPFMLLGPHGSELLYNLLLLLPYPLTVLYIYLLVKFRPASVDIRSLPMSFLLLPVLLFILLVLLRRIIEVHACPGGWEIMAVMAMFFYGLPFYAISTIVVERYNKSS